MHFWFCISERSLSFDIISGKKRKKCEFSEYWFCFMLSCCRGKNIDLQVINFNVNYRQFFSTMFCNASQSLNNKKKLGMYKISYKVLQVRKVVVSKKKIDCVALIIFSKKIKILIVIRDLLLIQLIIKSIYVQIIFNA